MQYVIGKPDRGSGHFRDSGIPGKIHLNWILKKPDINELNTLSWLMTRCISGSCEDDNKVRDS
jgi:hypothetical protein